MLSRVARSAVSTASAQRAVLSAVAVAPQPCNGRRTASSFANMAYNQSAKMLPKMSETERTALGCGTVGFDRDLFAGTPSLQSLLRTYQPKLTDEERAFFDNEVNELCAMIDDHSVSENKDFSAETWAYMRERGFFGMKIPKEWGGKGFSTQAVSMVLAKLGSRSFDANATVAVPNSLGPAELLVRYGTPQQQKYFLPLLADGTLIPCFGLTGPHSGSDATSLIGSSGVVERDAATGELGVRASFNKRYITLAPVAGVVGIGLDVHDPNNLLQGVGTPGFSVALLERGHPGLVMGPRHMPLNAAFMNGTVTGEDVWIPMDSILGGQKTCGLGWKMFVECLAEGRGVSLPAGAVAAGKTSVAAVGAYARIRKQFKVPIAEFGGIQEAMARITSQTLICAAGADLMNAIVDNHEAPMVISSIMKQSTTARGRQIATDAMDILAGAGISRGQDNFMANPYMNMPVAITVEGANIMTRSFQIIGQGLTRCHPHVLDMLTSLQDGKTPENVDKFERGLKNMVSHFTSNFARSISGGLKAAVSVRIRPASSYASSSTDKLVAHHEAQLARLAANFAVVADLALFLGGRLKFEELLMGRMADAMGALYLGYAVLHHQVRNQNVAGLEAVTEHAMLTLEYEAQEALRGAAENFPSPVGLFGRTLSNIACAPLGGLTRPYRPPGDALTKRVSELATKPSAVRDLFAADVYVPPEEGQRVGDLVRIMPLCVQADELALDLRRSKREPTTSEADFLKFVEQLRDDMIQVNTFEKLGFVENTKGHTRAALAQTEEWLADQSANKAPTAKASA